VRRREVKVALVQADPDVVAEGVEEAAQMEFLAGEGCLLAQGFHLGRPVTARKIEPLLGTAIVRERRQAGS